MLICMPTLENDLFHFFALLSKSKAAKRTASVKGLHKIAEPAVFWEKCHIYGLRPSFQTILLPAQN